MTIHRQLPILFFALFTLSCTAAPDAPILQPTQSTHLYTVDYEGQAVSKLDVGTGEMTAVWPIPSEGWVNQLSYISHTDDEAGDETLALSYMPEPNTDGAVMAYDRAGIYTLSLSDATLTPILVPDAPNSYFYNPFLTNDEKYLFYVRYITDPINNMPPDVMLMRHDRETGTETEFVKDGIWPRLSADSSLITMIIVDPETQNRGLIVMDIDGNNGVELVRVGGYYDIDTPLFSADGTHIYFTASLAGRKVTWFQQMFGVQIALAHADRNVPVEWMRVPVTGGDHEQLSSEKRAILYGAFDTMGETLYFSTLDGLFSMPNDGGAFTAVHPSTSLRTVTAK